MANAILNFHFDYPHPSLRLRHNQTRASKSYITNPVWLCLNTGEVFFCICHISYFVMVFMFYGEITEGHRSCISPSPQRWGKHNFIQRLSSALPLLIYPFAHRSRSLVNCVFAFFSGMRRLIGIFALFEKTLPKALRTQALTAFTSNFGLVHLFQYAW